MCGRFTLIAAGDEVAMQMSLSEVPLLAPRYNIAPSQPVAAVRLSERGEREFTHFQWGLIPSWAKEPSIGSKLINARAETVAEKPSFRAAFRRRRCLIPASGYYEWQQMDGRKQPMYIHRADGGLMAFAGLWELWQPADGSMLETCTILTTVPNAETRAIHNRMPVILDAADYSMWLAADTPTDQLHHLLRPFDAAPLGAYPVSTAVNRPQNDSPECIQPLAG